MRRFCPCSSPADLLLLFLLVLLSASLASPVRASPPNGEPAAVPPQLPADWSPEEKQIWDRLLTSDNGMDFDALYGALDSSEQRDEWASPADREIKK
jgi:hypothetical protein